MFESNAISLLELSKQNKQSFNKRGQNCTIYLIDYERKVDSTRYLFLVKGHESYSSQTGHIVTLLFDKGSSKYNMPLSDDVRVHCQCPSFIYHGVAFNATNPQKGDSYNLDIIESRPPNIRDPHREVKLCKHLVAVRNKLRNVSYKVLDKKAGIKKTSHLNSIIATADFKTVPIQETHSCIISYLETFKKEINPIEFVSSLTKENFEQKLLSVGAII